MGALPSGKGDVHALGTGQRLETIALIEAPRTVVGGVHDQRTRANDIRRGNRTQRSIAQQLRAESLTVVASANPKHSQQHARDISQNIAPQPSACHLMPHDKDGTQGVASCSASTLIEREVGDGSTLRAGTLCPVPQPGIYVFVATREGGDVIVRKNLPWLGEALRPHGALTQELLHLDRHAFVQSPGKLREHLAREADDGLSLDVCASSIGKVPRRPLCERHTLERGGAFELLPLCLRKPDVHTIGFFGPRLRDCRHGFLLS